MSVFVYLFNVLLIAVTIKIYFLFTSVDQCMNTSKKRLEGKTVIVTGGNSGIGFHTAKDLAKRGARVIITSENEADCERAKNEIIKETGNVNIIAKYLDLTSLAITRKFAKDILDTEERLDILINNAGTMGLGNNYSKDGLLLDLQVNYFGPFLLTHLLIGLLKRSKASRIVNVASVGSHLSFYRGIKDINRCPGPIFSGSIVYFNSKLFMLYMTWEFAARLKDSGVTVNCVSPGIVNTPIFLKKITWFIPYLLLYFYLKTPIQGAQTSIYVAVSDDVEDISGKYFADCKLCRPYIKKDLKEIRELWDKSIELVRLAPEEMQV